MKKSGIERIDTHQHLLLPENFRYPWVADFKPLQERYSLDQYKAAADGCDIAGTIFMEVDVDERQSGEEARFFSRMAEDPESGIIGVVASGRPEEMNFQDHLDSIAHPAVKGLRRVLHVVPDAVSRGRRFRENVASLEKRSLTFDLCLRADQLALAAELVDACPKTRFILDHCGCPDIAGNAFKTWQAALCELARRDNVAVKISGIPAYAAPGEADASVLRPWVEASIEAFGWDRCLWGGDWPVCTLNGTLSGWCQTLDEILAGEPPDNLHRLFSLNAQRIYRL